MTVAMMMVMVLGASAQNGGVAERLARQEEATRGVADVARVAGRRGGGIGVSSSYYFMLSSGGNTSGNDEEEQQ